jgi:hypothetical protein
VLNQGIQSAAKILERELKVYRQGKRVGQRVVAWFTGRNSNGDDVSILWTYEREGFAITAWSLHTALEFEKKFYGGM